MISVKISGKKHNIPNKFEDVTPKQLHSLTDLKPKTLIHKLTDIPEKSIDSLTSSQIMSLYLLLSFVEEAPAIVRVKEQIDVGQEAWRKFELVKQNIVGKTQPYIAVEVSRIYFGDQVFEWSIPLLYGQSEQILSSFAVFLERYKELNQGDGYDDDQLEAGVKGLETFGVAGIRYSLAKGDVTKYEQIENMKAEDIYITLFYEKAQKEYSDRYGEILERKARIGKR
jgi:hypothetical protein